MGGPKFLGHYIDVVSEYLAQELSGAQKETFLKGPSGVLVSDSLASKLVESGYRMNGGLVKPVEAPIPGETYQKSAVWIEQVRTQLGILDRPLTDIEQAVAVIKMRLPRYANTLQEAASALEASLQ